jgi:hypothetical protein
MSSRASKYRRKAKFVTDVNQIINQNTEDNTVDVKVYDINGDDNAVCGEVEDINFVDNNDNDDQIIESYIGK